MTVIGFGQNIAALGAQRHLGTATSAVMKSYQRLASGTRIASASDDAAGLAIVMRLNSDSRVFAQGLRNISDGLSASGIAEGALNSMKEITQRQLELAEQAANGSYSISQRRALNLEARKLTEEFNRIAQSTSFNGAPMFAAQSGTVAVQAGYSSINLDLGATFQRAAGTGQFTSFATTAGAYSVAAADFNGDGISDLATGSGSGLQYFIGNGDGTFKRTQGGGGDDANAIAFADVNSDGKIDVIHINNDDGLYVRLGNGDGTFRSKVTLDANAVTSSLAAADFNGDSNQDFLVNMGSYSFMYLGNGNGSFRSPITVGVGGVLAVADFNYDGLIDVAARNGSDITVRLGTGAATFGAALTLGSSFGAGYVNAADFNNDGFADIMAAGAGGEADVLIGNGDGSFRAALTSASALELTVAGDFDGDGVQDILTTSYYAPSRIFRGQSTQTANGQYVNIATQAGGRAALITLQKTLDRIGGQLSSNGASTSRFQAALGVLQSQRENTLSASSRIADVDVASESATLVREQIVQQAAAAVLTQANSEPRLALSLLSG